MTAFPLVRLAAIGVLALSFALSACGRRGPLDLPPRSSSTSDLPSRSSAAPAPASADPQQVLSGESTGEDEFGNPPQPKGQKKSFPLDPLLN